MPGGLKRREAGEYGRRARYDHALDKTSDESGTEFQDRYHDYSSSASSTSFTGTERSFSDKSPSPAFECSPKSPRSLCTSSPKDTPSDLRMNQIYPDVSQFYSEGDESGRNREASTGAPNSILPSIIIGLLVVAVLVMLLLGKSPSKLDDQRQAPYEYFRQEMRGLQSQLSNQDARFWKTIIASSKHILDEENSTYPSVIIVASQLQSPRFSFCVARKIASSFLLSRSIDSSQVPTTDIGNLPKDDFNYQKLLLDEDIQTAFQKPLGKAYVIRNLHLLLPQAALLLHGLCDGDNAPYKDVMILMTLEIDDSVPIMTHGQAEDYLARLWTREEVDFDKVAALMSRISNSLVLLKRENANVVEQMCPDSS